MIYKANHQKATSMWLEEILATQKSHQEAIAKLTDRLDDIVRLLEKQEDKGVLDKGNVCPSTGQSATQPLQNSEHQGEGNFGTSKDVTKRVCLEVADFYGKLNPKAFFDWLMSMENYSDSYSISEEKKVRSVKAKLKGAAHFGGIALKIDFIEPTNHQSTHGKR